VRKASHDLPVEKTNRYSGNIGCQSDMRRRRRRCASDGIALPRTGSAARALLLNERPTTFQRLPPIHWRRSCQPSRRHLPCRRPHKRCVRPGQPHFRLRPLPSSSQRRSSGRKSGISSILSTMHATQPKIYLSQINQPIYCSDGIYAKHGRGNRLN
jgi:hypothetical protein